MIQALLQKQLKKDLAFSNQNQVYHLAQIKTNMSMINILADLSVSEDTRDVFGDTGLRSQQAESSFEGETEELLHYIVTDAEHQNNSNEVQGINLQYNFSQVTLYLFICSVCLDLLQKNLCFKFVKIRRVWNTLTQV